MTATTAEKVFSPIDQFSGRRYINLETYKKNGEARMTPVQSIEDKGLIYFRTDPRTWKVKRLRNNPHVRIVVSDRNGKPRGAWADGGADILQGEERERILKLFKLKYGTIGSVLIRLVAGLRGERLTEVIRIKLRSPRNDESVSA